ncbi:MAG: GNAT family N-acetyltransferase [Halobacteriales archaeon]
MSPRPRDVAISEATGGRVTDAMAVLEAAMLEVDAGRVRTLAGGAADGAVLIATTGDHESRSLAGGVVLGALVLDGRRIEALAVRPRRRGQGIGSALVRAARDRADGHLIAAFDAHLREFYERLGFAVDPIGEARYRGRLE